MTMDNDTSISSIVSDHLSTILTSTLIHRSRSLRSPPLLFGSECPDLLFVSSPIVSSHRILPPHMGQALSSPGRQPTQQPSDSVRSRIRSSISNRLHPPWSTFSDVSVSRATSQSRLSAIQLLNPFQPHQPASPTPDTPVTTSNPSRRRTSRLFRRAQSSLSHIPTVFSRRAPSQARDSSSSLLLTSSSLNNQPSSARHTLNIPPELNVPQSPITTDNILDLNGSELHLSSRSISPAGRRRPLTRPSSLLTERLASTLRSERLSRSVSNPLRRRRPASTRNNDQLPVLSQLLSAAAAATAASLMGDDPNAVRNARGIGGDEGTLESFLESLQNGRMASALSRTATNTEGNDEVTGPQGINFVRLFRFASSTESNSGSLQTTETTREQDSSSAGDDESSSEGRMVPIIIVGIRSINPSPGSHDDTAIPSFIDALTSFPDPLTPTELPVETGSRPPQNGTRFSHRRRASISGLGSYDNQRHHRLNDAPRPFSAATSETSFGPRPPPSTPASTGLSAFSSGATTPTQAVPTTLSTPSNPSGLSRTGSFVRGNSSSSDTTVGAEEMPTRRNPRHRRLSESDFTRFGSGSSRRNGVVEPDDADTSGARSWIIYVLGGSYPENHPLLNTPSLFTDSPTYEDMLLLSSLLGPAKPPVASESDLESAPGLFKLKVGEYPGTIVGEAADSDEIISMSTEERCLVCLSNFEPEEEARRLVQCAHTFHRECIDQVSPHYGLYLTMEICLIQDLLTYLDSGLPLAETLVRSVDEKACKRNPVWINWTTNRRSHRKSPERFTF
jgi:RING finger family protein